MTQQHMTDDQDPITREDALKVAHCIARRLVAKALWSGDTCTWIISLMGPPGADGTLGIRQETAGPELYQGTAGIGVFLAECDRLTGDRTLRRTAAGAFRHAVRIATSRPYGQLGFFSGDAGVAHALHRYEQCSGDTEFAEAARRLIVAFSGRERADTATDIMSGAAGTLLGAVSLHEGFGPVALDVARVCGEQLLAQSRHGAGGWSWFPSNANARDLTGLAHGAAGIAHALLELFVATNDESYRFAAEQGFAYEREFRTGDNWLDLRHTAAFQYVRRHPTTPAHARREAAEVPPYAAKTMTAWCHGAPGIALTRLRAYALLGREIYRADAEMAVKTVRDALLRRAPSGDFSLCHGAAGLSETLLLAATVLDDTDAETDARRIAAHACRYELAGAPWPSGTLNGSYEPSLLLGEAGIGLHYLRLASPDVPSVLLVTGPRNAIATPSQDSDRVIALRHDYVAEHFGRILQVFARFKMTLRAAECVAGTWSGASEVERAFEAIEATIAVEEDSHRRAQFGDAFAPERMRYTMRTSIPARSDEYLSRAARTPPEEIDWRACAMCLSSCAQLVETRWDWDTWLASIGLTVEQPSEPTTDGNAYLVYCRDAMTHCAPLTPVAAAVISALTFAISLDALVTHVATTAGDEPLSSLWQRAVVAQLLELYEAGLLVVQPIVAAIQIATVQAVDV